MTGPESLSQLEQVRTIGEVIAWHAGQIAILRRAQGLEPTAPEA